MTSERESFREPPIFLADGRLCIYADGEYMAFSRDSKSWTTGTLDSRDISTLIQHLPIMADNTMHLFDDQEVTG